MICRNCGRTYNTRDVWALKDGNYVCRCCCDYIFDRNIEAKEKKDFFWLNLPILIYDEFKLIYMNPELASQCCNEELPISPFRLYKSRYDFERTEWLGGLFKITKSVVLEQDTYYVLSLYSSARMGKNRVKEYIIPFREIESIKVRYSPTKWQFGLACLAVYCTIFEDCGLYGVAAVLMFLWMSFGYRIRIKTISGNVYKIPTKRNNEEVGKLINCIEKNRKVHSINSYR